VQVNSTTSADRMTIRLRRSSLGVAVGDEPAAPLRVSVMLRASER
jgi:hypothetical protein